MALTAVEQAKLAMEAVPRGDIDLLSKILTDPDTVTIAEQRTAAERLGLKRGLLSAFVNVIADPTVWIAALMSRTFPVTGWLRGTIPRRYIGALNEFTGMSFVARPVEDFFRGTTIPRLLALKQRRESEVLAVGEKILGNFNRPRWREEAPIVSLLLEGQNPAGATPELRSIATNIRSGMDDLWGFLRKSQKIEGGFGDGKLTPARGVDFLPHEAPKYLRDYLPHIPITGEGSMMEMSGKEALNRLGRRGFRQAMELRQQPFPWTVNEADKLASDFVRFQAFMGSVGHHLNPRLFHRARHGVPLMSELGHELFVTDLNVVLPRYIHSVARTYANNAPLSEWERYLGTAFKMIDDGSIQRSVPTAEPIVVQTINEGIRAAGGQITRRPIAGTGRFEEAIVPGSVNTPILTALNRLVRAVQGTAGDDEILFGNLFNLAGKKLDGLRTSLGARKIGEADAAIRAFERHSSYRRKVNGLTSYLYSTTLGLNAWSSLQNLLQPVLTTMPAMGIGPVIGGYRVLRQRMPMYAREVVRHHRELGGSRITGVTNRLNVAMERGFRSTFPELGKQGIRIDPRLFDIDERLLTGPTGLGGKRYLRDIEGFNKLILQPFTHTEMANQIVTFYGAKQGLRNLIRSGEYGFTRAEIAKLTPDKLDDLLDIEAMMAVSSTQFRPGPGTRSVLQGMLPSAIRMFTSFPQRLGSFFVNSTVRGAMSNAQLEQTSMLNVLGGGEAGLLARQKLLSLGTGRNMGTLARSYLFSRLMVEGARQTLDVDLGGSLGIAAPFQLAPGDQPFAPLPFPPIASIVYGTVSAASTRDVKRLQPMRLPGIGDIPLPKQLVPGGIGIARAVRAVQQFRPDLGGFVDDDERLMYRGQTPDLILAMLGIPLDKNRRARDAIERTQAVRTRVRDFRRQFARAKMNYDMDEMTRLQQSWTEVFPDMPELTVADHDVLRYRQMARIPLVQRMLRTMGSRAKYLEADIYEHDPEILADPMMEMMP